MSLFESIKQIEDCEIHASCELTSYTTLRLESRGDLVVVKSVPALQRLLPMLLAAEKKYLVVGWGANQILSALCQEIIIHLDLPLEPSSLQELKSHYVLPASTGLNLLTGLAVRFGLKGWEVFTGVPASLGGAIYMNAGTNLGEIGRIVKSVTMVTPQGQLRTECINQGSFSYRKNHFVRPGEIIVEAELTHLGVDGEIAPTIKNYLEYRKNSQPLTTKNCGCVFKNPMKDVPAGKLIDSIGLKGIQLGGLRISQKHANFFENAGSADWDQFSSLIELIKFQMDHFYGIEFELEVKIPYD